MSRGRRAAGRAVSGRSGRRLLRRSFMVSMAFSLVFGVAWSSWTTGSVPGGSGAAAAATVEAGMKPVAVATGGNVAVSWAASTVSNGDPVAGYIVMRYDVATLTPRSTIASCSGTIATTSCTETSVPDGTWVYTVTPVLGSNWRGAESLRSDRVDVDAVNRPPLGSAATFSVLGRTSVTNSSGPTTVSGDLGVSPEDAVVGFPPGVVGGEIHAGDTVAAQAQADLLTAYNNADARTPTSEFSADLNGRTFHPGIHHTAAALGLTGTLTLDGDGDPNALFIIQVDAALNTAANSHVVLINGARASNLYWQVLGAAGTGADSSFAGTILANGAITLGANAVLIGRALSRGAVTLANNTIRFTDALPPTITIDGGQAQLTKDPTPTITGTTTAVAGRTVTVTVDDQTLTTTVLGNGTWTVTANALLAGTYPVVAKVRDAAGNAGFAQQQLTAEINPATVALGDAARFSVLGGTGIANAGVTTLTDDLGVSPSNSVTGSPTVGGEIHAGDSVAAQGQSALTTAYDDADGRRVHRTFAGDQIGKTFRPGVHHTSAAFALSGTLKLDADGDPNSVFIIQVDAALDTAANSTVELINGAQASRVFWQVQGAVTTGATSAFTGTILANGAVTLGAGSSVDGRVLSRGTVTLSTNSVTTD
jgi:hypothetical protein